MELGQGTGGDTPLEKTFDLRDGFDYPVCYWCPGMRSVFGWRTIEQVSTHA
ncbi:hypothetical protein N9444_06940 [Gammaproteobacteria bacterium]|nr:hypothetical protein [Gammaproteobacteria bacterium]